MKNGDRVRVRKTGETAIFVKYLRWPETWSCGRPDPPKWTAIVQWPESGCAPLHPDDIEPLERKP